MDTRDLRKRYLRGWFTIDFISALPINYIPGASFLRLFKILKLFRLMRLGRIFRRWQPVLGFRYTNMKLIKCLIGTIVLSHWGACIWGLTVEYSEDKSKTWLANFDEGINASVFARYVAALYWSMMTLTTIGYGAYGPNLTHERITAGVFCMVGGLVYAYIVGVVCSTVVEVKHSRLEYIRMRDMLNNYLQDHEMSRAICKESRMFFRDNQARYRRSLQKEALSQLSPGLYQILRGYWEGVWLEKLQIFHVKGHDDEALAFRYHLLQRLEIESFPRKESVVSPDSQALKMFIVQRGIMACQGHLLTQGHVIGEDIILCLVMNEPRRSYIIRTLNFVDTFTLHKDALQDVLNEGDFPNILKSLRKEGIKMALRRFIIKKGKQLLYEKIQKKKNDNFHTKKEIDCSQMDLKGCPELKRNSEIVNHNGKHWSNIASYSLIGKQLDRLLSILDRLEISCKTK